MFSKIRSINKYVLLLIICLVLSACAPAMVTTQTSPNTTEILNPTLSPTVSNQNSIPNFDHIVMIVLENKDFKDVIGSGQMPFLNTLAQQNVLLSNYFSVSHPSLPNYIALTSGSTQKITSDCTDCFINKPNLADEIETSGRTWKTYQEDMPSPCFVGDADPYYQKHDPFIYYDSIRLNASRCTQSIVPLTQLDNDLSNNKLPNFSFVMPNICNSSHSCSLDKADKWINQMITRLQGSASLGKKSLIVITFDEGGDQSNGTCCGLGGKAGGQVATVLISPLAHPAFVDGTAYSHYSLLKTILTAWNLPDLGDTATSELIEAPWIGKLDPTKTPTAMPDQTNGMTQNGELAFPIRGAFYYPWFPNSWNQNGLNPFTHYAPTLGYYTQDDPAVIQQQVTAMKYGKIQLGIASWWGQGHYTDTRIPLLLQAGEKDSFKWSLYVESEGIGNPSVNAIQSDLQYIRAHYANSPSYLKINGHFVVFVYADQNDGCEMGDRWKQANTEGAYLVLKVFKGYRACASQPDAWHQYAPDTSQKDVGKTSFIISPGFWKADEKDPRLPRDPYVWNQSIQAMVASQAQFQLITTFNEWGEGTSVESGSEWQSPSGYGLYLDALHYDGKLPIPSPSGTPLPTTKP